VAWRAIANSGDHRAVDLGDGNQTRPGAGPTFPVVGIGASAGGLPALLELLGAVPAPSGLALVVVTHQHPEHVTQLPVLLARRSQLDVVLITDGMPVVPGRVHVAPAAVSVELRDGRFRLTPRPASERSPVLLIDRFLRSLAAEVKERAVAVILSGTGSDGTLGAQEVKAACGLVIAQEPSSAQHDAMPTSAIRSGAVDHVLAPAAIAAALRKHAQALERVGGAAASAISSTIIGQLVDLVRNRTSRDFSQYKPATIARRALRRIALHRLADPQDYLRLLAEQPDEIDRLFEDLLIGVTAFFRDPPVWQRLHDELLAGVLRELAPGQPFRAWVPGCSTGEEAYTVAIIAYEVCERDRLDRTLQVFGTDLDTGAIDAARRGLFPSGVAADLGAERLERWFVAEQGGFRIRPEIRSRVIFAPHDVLVDPPFTRIDLLSCRNLIIYMQPALQEHLMHRFQYALNPGGLLVLGSSETVGQAADRFEVVDGPNRIFRRVAGPTADQRLGVQRRRGWSPHPASASAAPIGARAGQVREAAERALAASHGPAAIVVDGLGEVIHVHGRTGPYLELAPGRPGHNGFAMARPGLRLALQSAVHEALARGTRVVCPDLEVDDHDGRRVVELAAEPLVDVEAATPLVLVTFESSPAPGPDGPAPPPPGSVRLEELERQVQRSNDNLERSIHELQGANEELQSANEELQSTNEELETSKEELQSLNEELHTVNAELQRKVDALSEVNNDMANLLDSTEVATVFLDRDLRVKRFTPAVTALIALIDADIGRPLADFATSFDYPGLLDDAVRVLRTLEVQERQVTSRNGRRHLMRILPYRTVDNVIDGVVITFVDTTELVAARLAAEDSLLAVSVVETVREPLVVLDDQLRIVSANRAFCRTFRVDKEQAIAVPIHQVAGATLDAPELLDLLWSVVTSNGTFEGFELIREAPGLGRRRFMLNARSLRGAGHGSGRVLLAMEDAGPQP